MKRTAIWVLSIAGAIVAIPLIGILLVTLALEAGTDRIIYSRAASPDGVLEARVQFDDCGAACNFSRLVFIKRRWLSDNPWLSCRAFWADGEEPVSLEWTGNRTLLIRHGFQAGDIEDAPDRCGDVKVELSKLPP